MFPNRTEKIIATKLELRVKIFNISLDDVKNNETISSPV